MSKIWLVAEHQFKKDVLKRSFLLVLISMPLFLGFTAAMGYLGARLRQQSTTLGYVDQANVLTEMPAAGDDQVRLVRFATVDEARAALDAEQIDAYYALPPDYPQSRQTDLVFREEFDGQAAWIFHQAVRRSLLAGEEAQVVERALAGSNMAVHSTTLKRDFPLSGPTLNEFLPIVAAALFAFLVLTVSATLMSAVVTEKDNRTIEIVVSSISTGQMMAGKIIGVVGMSILLALSWLAILVSFAWFGANVLDWSWLQDITLNWRDLGLLILVALPCFLFMAALMVALGATMVDEQEAQQAGAFAFVGIFLPIYLFVVFANDPNGPLAIVFSMFPITAVTTLAVRSGFMEVPAIQFIASAVIALASGMAMIWLAGKAFRANMLRYGQRLRLRQLAGGRAKA
jgi:ABC-2 type transport system permease protein